MKVLTTSSNIQGRTRSLEIHGVPEDSYTSAEDVDIKLSELLNEPVRGENIDMTHKIYSGKNKPRNIIVKFMSHKKKKTALYKKRTALKNVRISQLFPHCPAGTALASKRLYINENLSPFRRDLMKEANQMKKGGMLTSVWSMNGKVYVIRLCPMAHHRKSIPRKTSTSYDSNLARLHFSASLSLAVKIILIVLRYELGWIRNNASNAAFDSM